MARLTFAAIEKIKGREERAEFPDDLPRGLYLVVQPSGAKSWAVRYRFGGKPRKLTLGVYPVLDLPAARAAAVNALQAVAAGRDPAVERKQAAETVDSAVDEFVEQHLKRHYRPGPLREAERLLKLYIRKPWGAARSPRLPRATCGRCSTKSTSRSPPTASTVSLGNSLTGRPRMT